eukprot:3452772-Rhodomonas_salina.1
MSLCECVCGCGHLIAELSDALDVGVDGRKLGERQPVQRLRPLQQPQLQRNLPHTTPHHPPASRHVSESDA